MNRRLRVGRILGVEVFVDWSWIVTFVLAAGTLVSLNRRLLPDVSVGVAIAAAFAAAAGLFASLGAHELVRVTAARGSGLPVHRLTLFVLGGVTDVERAPATPRTEVLGAVAAPAASLVVGLVLALGVAISSAPLPRAADDLDRMGVHGLVLAEIAAFNLAIAIVNLLPAYPLDGGRLLRALLWRVTGDVDCATRWAAWMGQVVGWTLVVVGIAATLGVSRSPFTALGTLAAFVGWFIASAAAQGYERVIAQRSSTVASSGGG
ncbi:MAG: site-2 protease family protein [Labilithrix sp.]|nr:site-2 protease family protein [Labilithrix sp.]